MLREELTVQSVGSVLHKVSGLQAVGVPSNEVRQVGVVGMWLNLEDEGREEGAMVALGVAQKEVFGLEGVGGKQETADRDGGEEVGVFQDGWSGVAAFSRTTANEEAGDVAFNELLVEVEEQIAEAVVGATLLA